MSGGWRSIIEQATAVDVRGRIESVVGLTVAAREFPAPLGARCRISRQAAPPLDVEVVGFRDDLTLMVAYGDLQGVRRGDPVRLESSSPTVRVGPQLLGRVIDGLGRLMDDGPPILLPHRVKLYRDPPPALQRPRIREPLPTGIRSIDGLLTCAKGQRLGIFSGSGVGKSTTLGMIARYCQADVVVVGLVGERGREVREFLEKDLGPEGRKRSVVVCATGDQPALVRLKAAFTATATAEYFRDQGRHVLLMMDSLTRLAMAQREIGLSAGEPPTTKGYPPSVFAMLPKLLERAGLGPTGSITGLYTVLVEGDDVNEIVSDTVRGILDGHVWLSRRLANMSHYPAVDVLESISRSMPDVVEAAHLDDALQIKRILGTYAENEDLITVGAYARGSNPEVDLAIQMRGSIQEFLRQGVDDPSSYDHTRSRLGELASRSRQLPRAAVVAQPSPPRGGSAAG